MHERPKELARPVISGAISGPTQREFREARKKHQLIERMQAAVFGVQLFHLLTDRVNQFLKPDRSPGQIIADLRNFYYVRPRPWRTHIQRKSVRAARDRNHGAERRVIKALKAKGLISNG